MTPIQHRILNQHATNEARGQRAFTLCPHISWPLVVAVYNGTERAAVPFDNIEFAKHYADCNAPAFVYRAAQVARVRGGTCYLRADNREPLYVGR